MSIGVNERMRHILLSGANTTNTKWAVSLTSKQS